MTRLFSDNVRSSSSRDKADKTARLQKDLESKQSSRIPIAVNGMKTKVDSKDNVPMNFKTTRRGKPFGGDSGMFISQQVANISFFTFFRTVSGERLESSYCLCYNIRFR